MLGHLESGDGEWCIGGNDNDNPVKEDDNNGNNKSVLFSLVQQKQNQSIFVSGR